MRLKPSSATVYLLKSLIPYTDANLKLTYKPHLFFNDLERLDNVKKSVAKTAYNRAIKKGLVCTSDDGIPRLTQKGIRSIAPFQSKKLKGAKLMVIYDIPEVSRWQRDRLRTVLHEFTFEQIQKSVWVSEFDCAHYIKEEIDHLGINHQVKIYEVRLLN